MSRYRTETYEKRIPRLMMAVIEGYPLGNLEAAMEELAYVASEYMKITVMLREKATRLTDEPKRRVLYDAVYCLENACHEFTKIRKNVEKTLKSNGVVAEFLLEQLAIIREEFQEVNKSLMELVQKKWWEW
jgi:hypothetical protein